MLKNLSSIALVGAMIFTTTACIIVTDDTGTTDDPTTTDGTETGTATGDGDGDATGDGDGDATGDGDGDPASGDGDGDATETGDGDGDTPVGMCGWDEAEGFYDCGLEGEDPAGEHPIGCPDGMVVDDPCDVSGLTGQGCCDADGNVWYCTGEDTVFTAACSE